MRPGRAHAGAADYHPTARVPYLGFEVGFDGARLRSDKRRTLWLGLQKRLLHADTLLRGQPLSERADALWTIDVPLANKDNPWSFDELDSMTVSIADAPRPNEILVAMAIGTAGRPNPRVGKGRAVT